MKIDDEEGITIDLSKLSPVEEERLRILTKVIKEDMAHIVESCPKDVTHITMIGSLRCSSCNGEIRAIERGWLFRLFNKKLLGYYCFNASCEFFHKFVPVEKAHELVSFQLTRLEAKR